MFSANIPSTPGQLSFPSSNHFCCIFFPGNTRKGGILTPVALPHPRTVINLLLGGVTEDALAPSP